METSKKVFMTQLRDKKISRAQFRKISNQLTNILACESMKHLQTKEKKIETPLDQTTGQTFADPIALIPILRSGIAMLPIFLDYFESATVGIVGLKRDEETAQANWYYKNLPPISNSTQIIILDPMLATGGTALETLKKLQKHGANHKKTIFVTMICAPEGIKAIKTQFPDVKIINASIDEKLNQNKFIVPGLGDFGDRYFGTE